MRGKINPHIGVTDANLRSQIRSALRKVWRNSARRQHIQNTRVPYSGKGRFKYGVRCESCGKIMGQSERVRPTLKDGGTAKRLKLAYEVDHVDGNPQFLDIRNDLGEYAHGLLYGKMQTLCLDCHSRKTYK